MQNEAEQKTPITDSDNTSSPPSRRQVPPELTMTPLSGPPKPDSARTEEDDENDRRFCVVCTEHVSADDTYYIEMHCGRHSHLYHADCIALWWFEHEERNCPRCTQAGQPFTVHARSTRGRVVTRTFAGSKRTYTSILHSLTLLHQSERFVSTAGLPFPKTLDQAGWEGIGSQMDIWSASVEWPQQMWREKTGSVAEAGMAKVLVVNQAWNRYWKRLDEEVEREQQWQHLEVAGVDVRYGVLPGERH